MEKISRAVENIEASINCVERQILQLEAKRDMLFDVRSMLKQLENEKSE